MSIAEHTTEADFFARLRTQGEKMAVLEAVLFALNNQPSYLDALNKLKKMSPNIHEDTVAEIIELCCQFCFNEGYVACANQVRQAQRL